MNKVINISSSGIKQAIDDLVNENEMLQDKVYKLESIIKEARKYIELNKVKYYQDCSGDESYYDVFLTEGEIIKLLEILDKVEENK